MSPVRPRSPAPNRILPAVHFSCNPAGQNHIAPLRRGTQVVRERSAKPLCVGSIPTRASKVQDALLLVQGPSLGLGSRLRARTPAKRLKFDSDPRRSVASLAVYLGLIHRRFVR